MRFDFQSRVPLVPGKNFVLAYFQAQQRSCLQLSSAGCTANKSHFECQERSATISRPAKKSAQFGGSFVLLRGALQLGENG
jgi:hypothetical protein